MYMRVHYSCLWCIEKMVSLNIPQARRTSIPALEEYPHSCILRPDPTELLKTYDSTNGNHQG